MKIILEFEGLEELMDGLPKIMAKYAAGEGWKEVPASTTTPKKKTEAPVKPISKEDPAAEAADAVEADVDTSDLSLFDQLKSMAVKLADSQRYEGVQLLLAKEGTTKVKEVPEEKQAKLLEMMTKMLNADSAKYGKMIAQLQK